MPFRELFDLRERYYSQELYCGKKFNFRLTKSCASVADLSLYTIYFLVSR